MDTIKSNNLGKGYALCRWFSIFNSMKYKAEEDRLNRNIELYTRYIVVKEELSIVKNVQRCASNVHPGYSDTDDDRRAYKDKELIVEIVSEKVKQLSTLQTELFKLLTYEYLNNDLQFNTLDIGPRVRSGILGHLENSFRGF